MCQICTSQLRQVVSGDCAGLDIYFGLDKICGSVKRSGWAAIIRMNSSMYPTSIIGTSSYPGNFSKTSFADQSLNS